MHFLTAISWSPTPSSGCRWGDGGLSAWVLDVEVQRGNTVHQHEAPSQHAATSRAVHVRISASGVLPCSVQATTAYRPIET